MKIAYSLTPSDVYKVLKKGLDLNDAVELHVVEELPKILTVIAIIDDWR